MKSIIDADTHLVESDAIWQLFDKDMWSRRPVGVAHPDPDTGRPSQRWVIDGTLIPKPAGKGGQALATPPLRAEALTERAWTTKSLDDVPARLEEMAQMGVDTQVIFPTLFIAHVTDDPKLDVALAKAYNRYVAQAWEQSHNKLRWVALLPFTDIPASIEQMHWSQEHGAVGFIARGIEGERSLAEPWFFPLYEEAAKAGMPMCIHTGPGCPALTNVLDIRIGGSFPGVRMLPVIGFQHLVSNRILEKFPDFKVGFLETGASWIPYVLHYIERDWRRKNTLDVPHLGPELFKNNRLFISCESDEDIPYLMQYIGEDNLVAGSDYGHHGGQVPTMDPVSFENRLKGGDPSGDLAIFAELHHREDISAAVVDKIVHDNPMEFYAI